MDRQKDMESQHVKCVMLPSAHTWTQENVSHRRSDRIFTFVFFPFECHMGGFSHISLSLYFFLLVSLSLPLSVLPFHPPPPALPVNSQRIFLLTWTVMHFCFLNVLALPPLPLIL